MATGGVCYFNKHAGYTKLVLYLMKCGTTVVRRLLEFEIAKTGQTFVQFVAARKTNIEKSYVGEKNKAKLSPSKSTDIKTWDICLIVLILLTECRSSLPAWIKKSLNDLRDERVKIAHSGSASTAEKEFNDIWASISAILGKLMRYINKTDLNDEIHKDIKDINEGLLEHDVAVYQIAMHHWHRDDPRLTEEIKAGGYI